MGSRFGPAAVQHNDWHGTVSLDNPNEHDALYRLAGLDEKEWLICGIDIFGHGFGIDASVLAVRRALLGDHDLERVASGRGGLLPVTEFYLPEGTALGLLRSFGQSSIRATLRSVSEELGVVLEIVDTNQAPWSAEPGT